VAWALSVTTPHPDPIAYPPRGLSRDEAARYVGVGATKFDEMVADGRMPRPKRVDGRVIWDRLRIEAAFSDLPDDNRANPLDRMLGDNR
jgi:excisionase family DNA binding protein